MTKNHAFINRMKNKQASDYKIKFVTWSSHYNKFFIRQPET